MDDIIIFGNTWEEHLSNVKQVFQRLQDAGLTIKLKNAISVLDSARIWDIRSDEVEFCQ